MKTGTCLFVIAVFTPPIAAQTTMQIVVDPGTHSGAITSMAADQKEELLITGSADKTVRLWDLRDGDLIKTIHLPIESPGGEVDEGRVYAVAIAPDDRTIAYGGSTGFSWRSGTRSFFTYDRQTDRIAEHSVFKTNVLSLAFAGPNGRYLVFSTSGRTTGIVESSNDYRVRPEFEVRGGIAGDVNGSNMAVLWRNPASNGDSGIVLRLYSISDNGLKLTRSVGLGLGPVSNAHASAENYAVHFSRDGQYLAVSANSDPRDKDFSVGVYSAPELQPLYRLKWDGKVLGPAVGMNSDQPGFKTVLRTDDNSLASASWRVGPQGPFSPTLKNLEELDDEDRIHTLALNKGRTVVGNQWGDWWIAGSDKGITTDTLVDSSDNIGISADGLGVYFEPKHSDRQGPGLFSLKKRSIRNGAQPDSTYRFFRGSRPEVAEVESGAVKVDGPVVASDRLGRNLYIATRYSLYKFGDGQQKWAFGLNSPILQLRASADGMRLFAAHEDGSFSWTNVADGTIALRAYVHPDRRRWIAWTPDGYYDAGPDSEDLAGLLVDRIGEQSLSADFIPLRKFRDRFYSPERVQAALTGARVNAPAAVITSRGESADTLPVATFSYQKDITIHSEQGLKLSLPYTVVSQTDDSVRVTVAVCRQPPIQARGLTDGKIEVTLTRDPKCEVRITASNRLGAGPTDVIQYHYDGPKAERTQKPKLYILTVGISDYDSRTQGFGHLNYTVKDAADIAAEFKKQEAGFYSEVNITSLGDGAAASANKFNIQSALDKLSEVKESDFVVIFMAGHGAASGARNFFITKDYTSAKGYASALSFGEITESVGAIKAHTLVLLDICHSGGFTQMQNSTVLDITRVANGLTGSGNGGVVVFTAASNDESARESEAYGDHGNGAFTAALKDALRGGAMLDDSGEIKIIYMEKWVQDRVKEITCGNQTPNWCGRGDFSVALAASRRKFTSPCSVN